MRARSRGARRKKRTPSRRPSALMERAAPELDAGGLFVVGAPRAPGQARRRDLNLWTEQWKVELSLVPGDASKRRFLGKYKDAV